MLRVYPAIFNHEADGGYTVIHCEDDPEDEYPEGAVFANLVSVDVAEYACTHYQQELGINAG